MISVLKLGKYTYTGELNFGKTLEFMGDLNSQSIEVHWRLPNFVK